MSGYEWVVAVPVKSNGRAHLAPTSGEQGWATRGVSALCGWAGLAKGTTPGQRCGESGRFRDPIYRRACDRCVRKEQRLSALTEGTPATEANETR